MTQDYAQGFMSMLNPAARARLEAFLAEAQSGALPLDDAALRARLAATSGDPTDPQGARQTPVAGDPTDPSIYNLAITACITDLTACFREIDSIGSATAAMTTMQRDALDTITAAVEDLETRLALAMAAAAGTQAYTDLRVETFTDPTHQERDPAYYQGTAGGVLPAAVDPFDRNLKLAVGGDISRVRSASGRLLCRAQVDRRLGLPLDVRYGIGDALDQDPGTAWLERLMADSPIVADPRQAPWLTPDYTAGTAVRVRFDYEQPTSLSEVQLTPFGRYPLVVLAVQWDRPLISGSAENGIVGERVTIPASLFPDSWSASGSVAADPSGVGQRLSGATSRLTSPYVSPSDTTGLVTCSRNASGNPDLDGNGHPKLVLRDLYRFAGRVRAIDGARPVAHLIWHLYDSAVPEERTFSQKLALPTDSVWTDFCEPLRAPAIRCADGVTPALVHHIQIRLGLEVDADTGADPAAVFDAITLDPGIGEYRPGLDSRTGEVLESASPLSLSVEDQTATDVGAVGGPPASCSHVWLVLGQRHGDYRVYALQGDVLVASDLIDGVADAVPTGWLPLPPAAVDPSATQPASSGAIGDTPDLAALVAGLGTFSAAMLGTLQAASTAGTGPSQTLTGTEYLLGCSQIDLLQRAYAPAGRYVSVPLGNLAGEVREITLQPRLRNNQRIEGQWPAITVTARAGDPPPAAATAAPGDSRGRWAALAGVDDPAATFRFVPADEAAVSPALLGSGRVLPVSPLRVDPPESSPGTDRNGRLPLAQYPYLSAPKLAALLDALEGEQVGGLAHPTDYDPNADRLFYLAAESTPPVGYTSGEVTYASGYIAFDQVEAAFPRAGDGTTTTSGTAAWVPTAGSPATATLYALMLDYVSTDAYRRTVPFLDTGTTPPPVLGSVYTPPAETGSAVVGITPIATLRYDGTSAVTVVPNPACLPAALRSPVPKAIDGYRPIEVTVRYGDGRVARPDRLGAYGQTGVVALAAETLQAASGSVSTSTAAAVADALGTPILAAERASAGGGTATTGMATTSLTQTRLLYKTQYPFMVGTGVRLALYWRTPNAIRAATTRDVALTDKERSDQIRPLVPGVDYRVVDPRQGLVEVTAANPTPPGTTPGDVSASFALTADYETPATDAVLAAHPADYLSTQTAGIDPDNPVLQAYPVTRNVTDYVHGGTPALKRSNMDVFAVDYYPVVEYYQTRDGALVFADDLFPFGAGDVEAIEVAYDTLGIAPRIVLDFPERAVAHQGEHTSPVVTDMTILLNVRRVGAD